MTIDNGNHLLLSGNRAALSYLDAIGARHLLIGPGKADMPFVDLKTSERWTLRANDGLRAVVDIPRRAAACRGRARSPIFRCSICCALHPDAKVGDVMTCEGPLYDRLVGPFLLAALNVEPPEGSAALAAAVVNETLLAGGKNYHPLIAREGLSTAFVEPGARTYHQKHGGTVAFERQLRALTFEGDRVTALDFGSTHVAIGEDDAVVLAVPPWAAASLVPDLQTPTAVPRHRQRAFQDRSADRACRLSPASSAARWNGCSPSPAGCRSPSAAPTGCSNMPSRGAGGPDLAGCRANRGHCG